MNLALLPRWLKPPVPEYEGSVRVHKYDMHGKITHSRMGRTVVVDGVRYASIRKAAQAHGVSYMVMHRKVAR